MVLCALFLPAGFNSNVQHVFLPGSTLQGLSIKNLHWPSCSRMNLVVHHVLQSLVVGGSQENLCVQLLASVTVEQHLFDKRRI